MKLSSVLPVAAAGALLAWIAWRSPEPDWEPLDPGRAPAPEHVPAAIVGELPEGYRLRTLAVEGMCCSGCAGKLRRALLDVPGVREAAVDPARGRASALVPEDLDGGLLERALNVEKYRAVLE